MNNRNDILNSDPLTSLPSGSASAGNEAWEEQSSQEESTRQISVVSFKIESQIFGIGILEINEIINLCPICPVPYTPEFILGVINLRGCINAVLDIRKFYRLKAAREYGKDSRVIVANVRGKTIGIVVDQIIGVVSIPESLIRKTPVSMDQQQARYISGIAQLNEDILILVNMDQIVNCEEMLVFRNQQAEE